MNGLGRVAIVGTGQVGTMIGMALRMAPEGSVTEVAAWDRDAEALRTCLARGGADRPLAGPEGALGSDVIVLATPVVQILGILRKLGPRMGPGQLVIDTGSAKAAVVEVMQGAVSPAAGAIGGHPLCGGSESGPAAADPGLLRGATFVLCPVREDPRALATARQLVELMGATAVVLSAGDHDQRLARTSHLPHLVAAALADLALGIPGSGLSSSGLRGAVRLARSDPAMVASFICANLAEVRAAGLELGATLERLLAAAAAGEQELKEELEGARRLALELGAS